ncbi:transcription elongation factor GreA [Candidatus Uhrbacteria bacterium]|nr:transcription elongation factor GreA [Candidatus Uhrbacteria bacterium]
MRLPIRKSERLKIHQDEGPLHLTPAGLQKLKNELTDIKSHQLPQAIEDVKRTAEFGDFSENAEYQEAKGRMRRLHTRIMKLEEQIKRAVVFEKNQSQSVQLGSTVVVEIEKNKKTFEIVGPHEANPVRGRISNVSPLGSALMNKTVGEAVTVKTLQGDVIYTISKIS